MPTSPSKQLHVYRKMATVAEAKFWSITELQEELLKHLDLQTTKRLAQTSQGIRNILQGGVVWSQLLARTSPIRSVSQVKDFVGILKLLKDIEFHLQTVKTEIMVTNPCIQAGPGAREGDFLTIVGGGEGEEKRISAQAFILVEELEGKLNRQEERVNTIFVSTMGSPLLSAIAARLSRQEQKATEVHIVELEVESRKEAFETKIMMTSCAPLEFHLSSLIVPHMEKEWWTLLACGLEAHTGIELVQTKKSSLEVGQLKDLKLIWNALDDGARWEIEESDWVTGDVRSEVIDKNDEGWKRLCEVVKIEEGEWLLQLEAREDQAGQDEEVG